jgi:cell fate (sporulation/competence/biofilm development) regulator YmcA (YheA/YmcA/DUF963 family)
MPFLRGQMVTEPDGSLLIKDVPMLAEGVWTDSAVGTPLNYIPKTLEEYAGNWIDYSGWSRHLGGVPRDSTDKVGEAIDPHYGQFTGKDGKVHQAVIADVRVHPHTQKSRDMQEMIRHGLISFVSVEHGGDERLNPATRQMEAASLTFTGFAFVNKGACKLCRLNEQPADPIDAKETPAPLPAEETMDTKELEAKLEAVSKELEAVKAQKPAEVKVEIPKELSEAVGKIKELAESNAALLKRIDALEKDGTPATGAGVTKELEALPEFSVRVDRKKGIVEA